MCKSCSNRLKAQVQATAAALRFIEEATAVHSAVYTYGLVEYINSKTKVCILCPTHGTFWQTPSNHKRGQGCHNCGVTSRTQAQATEASGRFILEAEEIHSNKYEYSLVTYINNHTSINIICPEHGVFLQNPGNHKQGQGCPKCCTTGFDLNSPAILYYIKVMSIDIITYKIGITNRTVQKRFSHSDLQKITIIKIWAYAIGIDAYNKEQEILRVYRDFRYLGEPILSSGNTELFTKDILNLDIKGK